MQVVPNTPGEVVLQPGSRQVTVLGRSEAWWITPIPPGSFRSGELLALFAESGTVSLPAGSAGVRARCADVVRETDTATIDLR
jgi:hypothetical protein